MLNIILIFIGLMAFAQSGTDEKPREMEQNFSERFFSSNQRMEPKQEDVRKLIGGLKPTLKKIQQGINQQLKAFEAEGNVNDQQNLILKQILQNINLMNSKKSCIEATSLTNTSGVYSIHIETLNPIVVSVPCNNDWQGGGWLVFQRRKDGSVEFNRNWEDYKNGFGDVRGEFFLGLEKLYAITNEAPHELLIVLKDKDNNTFYAKYDEFAIGDENQSYALNVIGGYSGNATDSLSDHKFNKFSTKDRDNDIYKKNCAGSYKSGWWFYSAVPKDCYLSNLNGVYKGLIVLNYNSGVDWLALKGLNDTLSFSEMMVKPKRIKFI